MLGSRVCADVTELMLEARYDRSERPTEKMKVWFSPFESEAALEHVFKCFGVRLCAIVLLRLGGFSGQRLDFDHHRNEFFELLVRYGRDTGMSLPDFVLTDKETENWDDPDPYVPD